MCLQLSKKVRLNNRVKAIKLPKTEIKIKDNDKCSVAGWGYTKSHGESISELLSVDVRSVNMDTCRKEWKQLKMKPNLPDAVICAGGSSKDGKGFCQVSTLLIDRQCNDDAKCCAVLTELYPSHRVTLGAL